MEIPVEARSPDISIGIVSGASDRDAMLCALNHRGQRLSTFQISTGEKPIRQRALEEGNFLAAMPDAQVAAMEEFLTNEISVDASLNVLIEASKVLPYPPESTPAGIISWHSAVLGALLVLNRHLGSVAFGCYEVPEQQIMVVHYVAGSGQDELLNQPRILSGSMLVACSRLILAQEPTRRQVAAIASLIASEPGAYYYWSMFGEPPSLGDIIWHRRAMQERMLVAVSPDNNSVSMRVRKGPQTDEEIALTYALAMQENNKLSINEANKIALARVCKEFGYDLRCTSRRADAQAMDPRRVWPCPSEDLWVLDKIKGLPV